MNNSLAPVINHHHYYYGKVELINEPTAIAEVVTEEYDPAGAGLFIIVVLLWYSVCVVCMLIIEIRARAETIEDCARRRAKLFIKTLQDQTETKKILEELADKEKRDKLWKIYLDKTDNNEEKLKQDEIRRLKNIEKKLAVIDRDRIIINETLLTPVMKNSIRRTSLDSQSEPLLVSNLSTNDNCQRIRRRSSFDQQIIERWKLIADQNKSHEQLPWPIRKILIRRHFRRYYKNSLKDFKIIETSTTNDEECCLLPTDKQRNRTISKIKQKTNEQANPYITYFHLPISENFTSNIQDLPLVTIKSDDHIIQMDDNEYQC